NSAQCGALVLGPRRHTVHAPRSACPAPHRRSRGGSDRGFTARRWRGAKRCDIGIHDLARRHRSSSRGAPGNRRGGDPMIIRHWRYDPFSARMCCCVLGAIATAVAGAASASPPGGTSQDALQEIVVSAAKTVNAVSVHDSPYAVTGFDQSALEDAHVGQLSDLTNYVPNVFLNSTETVQGVNNFSIRGMAVYDTIPSNTPTVGVFVDGLYLGASAASALNTFDLGSIEVLRGPQGLLFGQNVTAGAILDHTTDPTDHAQVSARIGVESDPSITESFVLTGPVMSDGRLDGKIAVYRNDDSGYFTNLYDNRKFGASRTTI